MTRCLLLIVGLWCTTTVQAADRPNFAILMTDDQRFDAMSCAGNPILQTPLRIE